MEKQPRTVIDIPDTSDGEIEAKKRLSSRLNKLSTRGNQLGIGTSFMMMVGNFNHLTEFSLGEISLGVIVSIGASLLGVLSTKIDIKIMDLENQRKELNDLTIKTNSEGETIITGVKYTVVN